MKRVLCLDDGTEYFFTGNDGCDAIHKMLYTLDLKNEDKNAKISCGYGKWILVHNGKTYACTM